MDVGVAGHAARFGQGGGVEAVAEADDPGAGGNDGHVGEAGGLVAVEIGAAVVDPQRTCRVGGRSWRRARSGRMGPSAFQAGAKGGIRRCQFRAATMAAGRRSGVFQIWDRAEDRDFGCGDAA